MLEEENLSSHNSKLHLLWGAWKCWYWWCTVCMVKSCSSMICWQPSGFSMHMSLCHVCLVDSSGVLERAILQGLWTHLSGLVMKKKTNARGTAGCLLHRLQRFIPAEKTRKHLKFRNMTRIPCFDSRVTFEFKISWLTMSTLFYLGKVDT